MAHDVHHHLGTRCSGRSGRTRRAAPVDTSALPGVAGSSSRPPPRICVGEPTILQIEATSPARRSFPPASARLVGTSRGGRAPRGGRAYLQAQCRVPSASASSSSARCADPGPTWWRRTASLRSRAPWRKASGDVSARRWGRWHRRSPPAPADSASGSASETCSSRGVDELIPGRLRDRARPPEIGRVVDVSISGAAIVAPTSPQLRRGRPCASVSTMPTPWSGSRRIEEIGDDDWRLYGVGVRRDRPGVPGLGQRPSRRTPTGLPDPRLGPGRVAGSDVGGGDLLPLCPGVRRCLSRTDGSDPRRRLLDVFAPVDGCAATSSPSVPRCVPARGRAPRKHEAEHPAEAPGVRNGRRQVLVAVSEPVVHRIRRRPTGRRGGRPRRRGGAGHRRGGRTGRLDRADLAEVLRRRSLLHDQMRPEAVAATSPPGRHAIQYLIERLDDRQLLRVRRPARWPPSGRRRDRRPDQTDPGRRPADRHRHDRRSRCRGDRLRRHRPSPAPRASSTTARPIPDPPVVERHRLPVVLFAEGGGGRPETSTLRWSPVSCDTDPASPAQRTGSDRGSRFGLLLRRQRRLVRCCGVIVATGTRTWGWLDRDGGRRPWTGRAGTIGPIEVQVASGTVDVASGRHHSGPGRPSVGRTRVPRGGHGDRTTTGSDGPARRRPGRPQTPLRRPVDPWPR